MKGCCCKDIMMIMVQSQGLITPFHRLGNMMPQSSILFVQEVSVWLLNCYLEDDVLSICWQGQLYLAYIQVNS